MPPWRWAVWAEPVDNRTALVLGILLAGAAMADQVLNEGAVTVFLLRELMRLTEWMAFWR